jgi:hypothetical protein
MSTLVTSYTGTQTRDKPKLDHALTHGTARSSLECLIVSSSASRRELFSRAATASGWSSVVCGDTDSARYKANRIVVKLAIIDMEKTLPAESGGLRELSTELAGLGGPLLVLCGADCDPQQEIWARQLGAWLYLPGMAGAEAMTLVCDEARQVVERTNSNGGAH